MRRSGAFRAGFLAVASIGAAFVGLRASGADTPTMAVALALLACILAALAVAFAYAGWRRAAASETTSLALARALDQVGPGKSAPDIDTIAALVAKEVARVAGPPASPVSHPAPAPADAAPPLLPLPADAAPALTSVPAGATIAPLFPRAVPDRTAADNAIVSGALGEGRLDIALRPVISLSAGATAGFDVFAEILAGGDMLHIARPAGEMAHADRLRFERLLLEHSVAAAGRVAADAPLLVPVSRLLLEAGDDPIVERLRATGQAARAIVLDIAVRDLPAATALPPMLEQLLDAGVGLCVDLEDARETDPGRLHVIGARRIRLSASRLLGHTVARGRGPGGATIAIAARAAGLAVIADDVASEGEALALADLGVDLMTGALFGAPRRLGDTAFASRTAAE